MIVKLIWAREGGGLRRWSSQARKKLLHLVYKICWQVPAPLASLLGVHCCPWLKVITFMMGEGAYLSGP